MHLARGGRGVDEARQPTRTERNTAMIADGAFSLMETCVATPGSVIAPVACTDPGSAPEAFGWLGALVGFWFAYTGRLARLFRKV
jgi:hypothetical protein